MEFATYRLRIIESGDFIEKEFQISDDPDADARRVCREMILHAPEGVERGVELRLLAAPATYPGCDDLGSILNETIVDLGYRLAALTNAELEQRWRACRKMGESTILVQWHLADNRFRDEFRRRGLYQYTATITLDGEDGEPAEREYRIIWAPGHVAAKIKALEWASEVRDETRLPWGLSQLVYSDREAWPDDDESDLINCEAFHAGCDWMNEPTEDNILDADLPAARDTLPGMKFAQLCRQAIEIVNAVIPGGQEGEHIKGYLNDLNLEIIKRVAFWALITLLLALSAVFGGGMLTLHLAGGTMVKAAPNGLQGTYAAAVIVAAVIMAALGIANKKLIALENWAATWVANLAARTREDIECREGAGAEGSTDVAKECVFCKYCTLEAGEQPQCTKNGCGTSFHGACEFWERWTEDGDLEHREREDGKMDAPRECAACKHYQSGSGVAFCNADTLEAVSTSRACGSWEPRQEDAQ